MDNFDAVWEIFKYSFPEEERRSFEEQKNLLKNPLYNFNTIYDCDLFIGFIAFWTFKDFIFIEHLAIDKNFRGKGYGGKIVKDIISKYDKIIILEVEKTKTTEAIRRISFYKNLKFYLNKYDYLQPPLSEDKKPVPLFIMSYPKNIDEEDFINIRNILYTVVYNVKERTF
ncbi:MAG: GNAT family N-acetyltransferase [Clostridiales bacterium]|nr:GNAT family N-acetyltransferase [Clostridiales bacterium]